MVMSIPGDSCRFHGAPNDSAKDVEGANEFHSSCKTRHRGVDEDTEAIREASDNGGGHHLGDSVGNGFLKEEIDQSSLKGEDETSADMKRKKKKKRRYLTICTNNCKYDVVRRVACRYGMREVTEDSSWNLCWTDLSINTERAKDMKRFQKINHFPGMTEICRKDLLARNLNRMLRLFPKDYNFFPKTWCFPADHGEAVAYSKLRRSKTFIIKPETGCQGRGIYITKNLKDVKLYDRLICQVYLSKPYLIDGFKFDFRVYALITSCDPLRIYVYNDGLARFATTRYKEPTGQNTSNVYMHLTNYSVNKHNHMYIIDDEIGSKRKISTLNKWLRTKDVNVNDLWDSIDEIIIKTVIAAHPVLKHSYHTCFPTHNLTYACFEILGFDVLLDSKLKPFLLEVNHSPSFHTDARIDKDVKESLLIDTFEMLNLHQCDKRRIMEQDKKRIRERLLRGINVKDVGANDGSVGFTRMDRMDEERVHEQSKWEEEHLGNFRKVYPGADSEKYLAFFKQTGASMFQDTVTSRARQEASNIQRAEVDMEAKSKLKDVGDVKRLYGKWSEQKLGLESPSGISKTTSTRNADDKRASKKNCVKKPGVSTATTTSDIASIFEPEIICESEERERLSSLAQREFLIKSSGVLEQLYRAMMKNGSLRPADVKLYGMYEKLGFNNQ